MNAEQRDIIVRGDALGRLGRGAEEELDDGQRVTPYRADRAQPARGLPDTRRAGRLGMISEKDLERLVTARFEYPPLQPRPDGPSQALAAAYNPYSAKGRALRYLAARIMLDAYTREGLCFSVSGAHSDCGATYVAANLGVVFSELGLSTLVIDANLRRPGLHGIFNWTQQKGLATMIVHDTAPASFVAPMNQFRSLSILPAGRHAKRVSNRLGNGVLARVISTLRPAYDVIICDAPALSTGGYDGCEQVAGMCGNTITVFRKDHTGVGAARRLLKALDSVGTRQIGSVLCEF